MSLFCLLFCRPNKTFFFQSFFKLHLQAFWSLNSKCVQVDGGDKVKRKNTPTTQKYVEHTLKMFVLKNTKRTKNPHQTKQQLSKLCKNKKYNEKILVSRSTGINIHLSCYYTVKQARQAEDAYEKLACCTFHLKKAYSCLSPVSYKTPKPTVTPSHPDKMTTQDFILLREPWYKILWKSKTTLKFRFYFF